MKICTTCKSEKELSEFFKSSSRKGGYEHRCKECKVAINRISYLRNKESIKLRAIKRKYNLDSEEYLDMMASGCEVCGSFDNLCIDHDHNCCDTYGSQATCGKCVRGVLCRRCNIAEGLYKDDGVFVKNLVKYMIKHGIIK